MWQGLSLARRLRQWGRIPVAFLSLLVVAEADERDGPLLARPPAAGAELPPDADTQAPEPSVSGTAAPAGGWTNFLRDLSQEVIPDEYEVRENWGNRKEVFAGFNVRDGELVPRISKRTKRVKHGTWRRFQVRLIDPEERLWFEVRNSRLDAAGGLACEVVLSARLRCTANAEFWNLGVKTGSATVQSDITLKAVAEFRIVGRQLDPDDDSFFTEMEFMPQVDDVRLRLTDIDTRRIGKLDGDVAEALGDGSRQVVQHFVEEQEPKVRKRIARELADADATLRVPMPRAMFERGE